MKTDCSFRSMLSLAVFITGLLIPPIAGAEENSRLLPDPDGKPAAHDKPVKVFKMKNRKGFAALFSGHLTEGRSKAQALDRMVKAVRRTTRKKAKKRK